MSVIYTIPGLGTTEQLFKYISVPGHELKVLSWPIPQPDWSLKDYARAFLPQIDTSGPANLMGVSFGGMLCSELAELIQTDKVVLISSCKNRDELPVSLKTLKFIPLQRLINNNLYQTFAAKLSWIVGFEKDYLPEFLAMMRSMPENYFKLCIHMIIHWDRTTNSKPIYHLQGNADTLLPHSFIKNYELVERGNHAMIVYKAKEINVFLKKVFNGL